MHTTDVQRRLKAIGFYDGAVDGRRGALTFTAIERFQRAAGLPVTGGIDTPTAVAILDWSAWTDDQESSPPDGTEAEPGWLVEAKRLHDIAGDDAMSGLIVAACVASTMPGEGLPAYYTETRDWMRFGIETDPRVGAILVFKGAVGVCVAEQKDTYEVVTGVKGKIAKAKFDKDTLIGARWPATQPPA